MREDVYVLKNEAQLYLAPTYKSKFSHVTIGDLVPEQQYACRYWSRNAAVQIAVDLNNSGTNRWRAVRLKTTPCKSTGEK